MSDQAIKSALEAAGKAASDADQVLTSERNWRLHVSAAAIAAFLRECAGDGYECWGENDTRRWLENMAAAVEAAAREGGG